MPNLNPLKVGDEPYPQYSVTTTQPVSANLVIVKGTIYTKDAAGNLIAVAGTVAKGLYQAKVAALTDDTAGNTSVQCLGQRTRILMAAPAGLVEGDSVGVAAGGSAIAAVIKSALNYIGTVYEVYTKDANGQKKKLTVAADLVVIDMAGI